MPPSGRVCTGVSGQPPAGPVYHRSRAVCMTTDRRRRRRASSTRVSRQAPPTPHFTRSSRGRTAHRHGLNDTIAVLWADFGVLVRRGGVPYRRCTGCGPLSSHRQVHGGNCSDHGATTQHVLTSALRTAQQRRLNAAFEPGRPLVRLPLQLNTDSVDGERDVRRRGTFVGAKRRVSARAPRRRLLQRSRQDGCQSRRCPCDGRWP